MAYLTNDLITLLKFLLPGFLTAQIFYRLTAFPKKSEFEAIVVALIFTIIIEALLYGLQALLLLIGTFFSLGPWTTAAHLVWSIVLAVVLGLFFAYFMNNDKIHDLLRRWRITHQTSYPSEWFGTFVEYPTYIVLHLKDQRRLYGWPREWPSSPKEGHFVIEDAEWLLDAPDSSEKTSIPLVSDKYILMDVASVEFVELVKKEN